MCLTLSLSKEFQDVGKYKIMNRPSPSDRKLVVGVTVGISAHALLKGQLAWFNSNGWDVTLVSNPDELAKEAVRREQVSFFGIKMEREISIFKDLGSLFQWVKFLIKLRPDAVSVGTPKAALLGITAAWITRVPRRLYVVRGLRLEGLSGLRAAIQWIVEQITMRLATDVLYISNSLAEECRSRNLLFEKKAWLNGKGSSNGVDSKELQQNVRSIDRKGFRIQLGISDEQFVVGFVGRMNVDKGVDTLLKALKDPNLDDSVVALLVGPSEQSDLKREIQSLGGKVISIGWTDAVWKYLTVMDVLCFPSKREGFGNVVLEAASVGVPAITTTATGAIDTVIHEQTGYALGIGDSRGLVEKVNELCQDPSLVKLLGEAARSRAVADFQPIDVWSGLDEILTGSSSQRFARRFGDNSSSVASDKS